MKFPWVLASIIIIVIVNYKKILTVREGEVGGGTPPMMTVSGKYNYMDKIVSCHHNC